MLTLILISVFTGTQTLASVASQSAGDGVGLKTAVSLAS